MNVRIIRIPAPTGFTQVPNYALRDERLSYKARGIHANLLSNSDEGWTETAESLAEKSTDGRDACRSGLRELVKYGYIEYRKAQGPGGKWSTEMIVYTVPRSVSAGRTEDGKPASGTTRENTTFPQVAPKTENPSSVEGDRGRETRSRSDQAEREFPQVAPRAGYPASGQPAPIQKTITEDQENTSRQASSLAVVPEQALPLVRAVQATLPGLRWNLSLPDWLAVQTLMSKKGVEAMADYAARVSASSAKPVFSARYFLPGWKELPDAAPDGTAPPQLRAVTSRRQQETDDMFERALQRARARDAMETGQ